MTANTVDELFEGKELVVRTTYDHLLRELRKLGLVTEEVKKTSIHLVRQTGFAGVHPRKGFLLLNIRTDSSIQSPRIHKTEQVSKNRFHNEIKLQSPDDVDPELLVWLAAAYRLSA
jgi:hypothetical protein